MPRVAGIVLAAGLSTRLGRPKQLIELCGKPALQHVIDTIRRTRLSPVILVLNRAVTEYLETLDTRGCTIVVNEHPERGQSASLQAGLAAVPSDTDAVVFVLGDQPFVEPATIEGLIDLFISTSALVVRPRYADGPGNPVLVHRRLFTELAELEGDVGARPVLAKYAAATVELDARDRPMPLDLDTPEDVERARRRCVDEQSMR